MVMPVAAQPCTLLVKPLAGEVFDVNECRRVLEIGSESAKIDAMRGLLRAVSNGVEGSGSLVMHVIRFVMPNQKNKFLKKLVLYFFELVPKVDGDGRLLQEMILLCNALRSDLQHPNEYVRGVTLRFVCKLREAELLEPLVPEHSHPYVRRNAIFAVWSIWEKQPMLLPDAPELVEQVLAVEGDAGCQRNAFAMLAQTEPWRASVFFESIAGRLDMLDTGLQLAIIQFMLSDEREESRDGYARVLLNLISSGAAENMVKYEACGALMALSASPAAIRAIAGCYVEMGLNEADNNSKLVLLDRLAELQAAHPAVVNEGAQDVLRILGSSTDAEIRRRALGIVLGGVSAGLVGDLVGFLGKEVGRRGCSSEGSEEGEELAYAAELLRAVHEIASRFPASVPAALEVYLGALENGAGRGCRALPAYLKDPLEKASVELRSSFVSRVSSILPVLPAGTPAWLLQALLWLLGEYATSRQDAQLAIDAVGELCKEESAEETREASMATRVLADGTYVVEAASSQLRGAFSTFERSGSTAASIALALTRLLLRWIPSNEGKIRASCALLCTGMLRSWSLDPDAFERVLLCVRVLGGSAQPEVVEAMERKGVLAHAAKHASSSSLKSAAAPLRFRLAEQSSAKSSLRRPLESAEIAKATQDQQQESGSHGVSALSHLVQLTGCSDPIYAETYVLVVGGSGDVILDVLLVNQTDKTITGLGLDLACVGPVRLAERPAVLTLPPHGFASVKAALRVDAAAAGIVHGALTYGDVEPRSLVLAPIQLDVVDFLLPHARTDEDDEAGAFRRLWPLLEWENKIVIGPIKLSTPADSQLLCTLLQRLLDQAIRKDRLVCITPDAGLAEGGLYLAANMLARSVFGEELLANICLEKNVIDGNLVMVAGHARLRARSQAIAVALGDKISAFFKSL